MTFKCHKWSSPNTGKKATSNKGGVATSCLRCGCVREYVNGKVTYFINDTIYFQSPECNPSTV